MVFKIVLSNFVLVWVENICLMFGSGLSLENFGCKDLLLNISFFSMIGEMSVISIMLLISGSSVSMVFLISRIICLRIRFGFLIILWLKCSLVESMFDNWWVSDILLN